MNKQPEDFIGAGCELATPFGSFFAIYQMSNGQPCNGCAYDAHGSSCKAKKTLFSTPTQAKLNPANVPTETVREQAARLGISISEVRRRKRVA